MAKSTAVTSKGTSILTFNAYRESLTGAELQQIRRKLAKQANQRLVRLERTTSKVTGESYASYGAAELAYEYTQKKYGGNRFKESLGTIGADDTARLREEITRLQSFLSSKSSRVKGQKDIEKLRIKTFESGQWGLTEEQKKQGATNRQLKFASNKEFYDFLNSNTFKELVGKGFDSEQLIELYDQALQKEKGDFEKVANRFAEALDDFREGIKEPNLKELNRIVKPTKKQTVKRKRK